MMASIPLSAVRVPGGKVAVTLDLHGTAGVYTGILEPAELTAALRDMEQVLEISVEHRRCPRSHVRLRSFLRQGMIKGDEEGLKASMVLGAWLTLNHPENAERVRAAVSASLRERGKAHLTITSDGRGMWGFGVSERPGKLAALMTLMPAGSGLVYNKEPEGPEAPPH